MGLVNHGERGSFVSDMKKVSKSQQSHQQKGSDELLVLEEWRVHPRSFSRFRP